MNSLRHLADITLMAMTKVPISSRHIRAKSTSISYVLQIHPTTNFLFLCLQQLSPNKGRGGTTSQDHIRELNSIDC